MFNVRLKELRKSHKSTQKQVAAAIGLSERNYQDFEYGKIKPSFDTLLALAKYFSCTVDYLLGNVEEPQHENFSFSTEFTETVHGSVKKEKLSEQALEFAQKYDKLSKANQEKVLDYMKLLEMADNPDSHKRR